MNNPTSISVFPRLFVEFEISASGVQYNMHTEWHFQPQTEAEIFVNDANDTIFPKSL